MKASIALLRAINVAGHNSIRMADLKALHESLGLTSVRTLLNSGNVVFAGGAGGSSALSRKIEAAIDRRLGLQVTVIVRAATELGAAIAANPFPEEAKADPGHLVLMFLAAAPTEPAVARLTQAHAGPERFQVHGREAYIHYPAGIGKSKLTNAWIEKQLGVTGTARNWNTVAKLRDMAASLSES
jgi:uncharacterized protein (DUF1697 family)